MNDEPKAKPSEPEAEAKAAAAEIPETPTDKPVGEPPPDSAETTDEVAESDDPAAPESAAADPPEAGGASDAAVDAPEAEPATASEAEIRAQLIETLAAENADLKDRLLRAAAEMENIRRRYEREMADARQYAVTGFAREVLSIGDNLTRAIAAVPDEARKEGGAIKALLDGVEMTERELNRVLGRHGVTKLEPEGKKFDPNLHQAIFEVEHEEAPHGTVVEVVQAGYSIGDRVLRPAMVGIAKQAKKTTEPEKPDTGAGDGAAESKPAETTVSGPKAANDG
jgi:molecular chaperone GrpE